MFTFTVGDKLFFFYCDENRVDLYHKNVNNSTKTIVRGMLSDREYDIYSIPEKYRYVTNPELPYEYRQPLIKFLLSKGFLTEKEVVACYL